MGQPANIAILVGGWELMPLSKNLSNVIGDSKFCTLSEIAFQLHNNYS